MTTCRNCKKELDPSDSFCRKCGQVVFVEENLEAAVREELEKPEDSLTKGVIRELTKLHASEREIDYLRGLDSASTLKELRILDLEGLEVGRGDVSKLKRAIPNLAIESIG